MFFINDRVGVAYESCEGGLARYNPKDDDFNILMANEEIDAVLGDVPVRRVTEEEALDFMRSKFSAEGTSSPCE